MKTHLLIDGDVIAFIAASAAQGIVEDAFGLVYPIANVVTGRALVANMLFSLEQGLKADSYDVYLSCPDSNWRHSVDPTYKGNRDPAGKPLILGKLKDYLREKYGATSWPSLEADDVLGILATTPSDRTIYDHRTGGLIQTIVVGRDKDFKSIPGLHHQWKDTNADGSMRVRSVSQWEGDRFHLIQTLAGDAVDGYAGCPGIGMKRAEEIIDAPVVLRSTESKITRGPRKGERTLKWVSEPTRDYWECVITHYHKAMHPSPRSEAEAAALNTARLARILRYGEYDRETERLTLWTPDRLPHV